MKVGGAGWVKTGAAGANSPPAAAQPVLAKMKITKRARAKVFMARGFAFQSAQSVEYESRAGLARMPILKETWKASE
jgi:hypothetical protein